MQILNDVADMNGYLKAYGSVLAEAIKGSAEPLFNPGDRWDDKLYSLLRKPYQAQGDDRSEFSGAADPQQQL
jgi:hypothetical protein